MSRVVYLTELLNLDFDKVPVRIPSLLDNGLIGWDVPLRDGRVLFVGETFLEWIDEVRK